MKHIYLALIAIVLAFNATAQTVASFDQLTLTPEKFWNGSDESGSFDSGGVSFYNSYNTQWGSWSGFAYSNVTDGTTAGFGNQYSAITGSGNEGSSNYAVCYTSPLAELQFAATSKATGFQITNSTYAYLSMKLGDATFAKKFGGESGNDPDFFKLMIEALNDAGEPVDTVNFYLADFRFTDNSKDYILNKWTWVDLNDLNKARKLRFSLSSSDNGVFGMNTPSYFCMDDLNYKILTSSPNISQVQSSVYPNPFYDHLIISGIKANAQVTITDISGRTMGEYNNVSNNQVVDGLNNLRSGIYFLKIIEGMNHFTTKLVKK
jgi:hypothetical protein